MRPRIVRVAAALLALALPMTTAPLATFGATVAYADLPRLVASHPLHGVLAQYDAEIAALRNTQGAAGLHDPAEAALHGATAVRSESSAAATRALAIGDRDPAANRAREANAIAQLTRAEQTTGSGFATGTRQLVSETNANLRAYGGALAQRMERAYAARAQELRDKELTLAYNLEQRDAGARLTLRLKLDDLHLTAGRRAKLQTELAALNAGELRPVEALRRADAGVLSAYRWELERDAANGAQTMDRQLRDDAGANYAILQHVFNEAGSSFGALPPAAQLAAFSRGYAASNSAQTITSGMREAGDDLAARLRHLAATDAQSQRDSNAQLQIVEADRAALYRAIVAQIRSEALAIARTRGLGTVEFVTPPPGSVDLTSQIAAREQRDWRSE